MADFDFGGQTYSQPSVYEHTFAPAPGVTAPIAPAVPQMPTPVVPQFTAPTPRATPQIQMPNTAIGMANASPNFVTTPTPFTATMPTFDQFFGPARAAAPAQAQQEAAPAPTAAQIAGLEIAPDPVQLFSPGDVDTGAATSFQLPEPPAGTTQPGDVVYTVGMSEDGSASPPGAGETATPASLGLGAVLEKQDAEASPVATQKFSLDLFDAPAKTAEDISRGAAITEAAGNDPGAAEALRKDEALRQEKDRGMFVEQMNVLADTAGIDDVSQFVVGGKLSPTAAKDIARVSVANAFPGLSGKAAEELAMNSEFVAARADYTSKLAMAMSAQSPGQVSASLEARSGLIKAAQEILQRQAVEAVPGDATTEAAKLASWDLPQNRINANYMGEALTNQQTLVAELEARGLKNTSAWNNATKHVEWLGKLVTKQEGSGKYVLTGSRGDYIVDGADLLQANYAHRTILPQRGWNTEKLNSLLASDLATQNAVTKFNEALADPNVDSKAAATKFWSTVNGRISALGKSEDATTHGFWGSRDALGNTTTNWANVMSSGALALALYAPFERKQAQRDAEAREDELWEKQKAWQRELMGLQNDYRLQQIGAQGEADRGGGSTSAANVAQFA